MFVAVRGEPDRAAAAIRNAVRRASPDLPPVELRSMQTVLGEIVVRPRFLLYMLAIFAASALALASLGIYGLLSFSVVERTQELSIRMALGVHPAGVIWMILRQGMTLAIVGCAAGVFVAWVAARALSGFLFGVRPGDPMTLAEVALAALVIAAFACALPALRASRVNVLDGLRN
jgi:ABC-type antimicrobial peptide transport system permease subunit